MTVATVVTAVLFAGAAALGACLRVVAGARLNQEFPFGTFVVNIGAAFAAGALSTLDGAWATVAVVAGLGALSTWSTVATEVGTLARARLGGVAVLYLCATVTTGVLAAWLGLQVAA